MIDESQKIGIPSKTNGKELELELNWNTKVKPTDVRVRIGKEELVIDLKDLFFFVFTAGTADMQADLMPVRQTKVYKQIRQHRLVLKKDMKAGQMVIANCETDVETSVVDSLKGELFKSKGRSLMSGSVGTYPTIKSSIK